MRCNWWTMGKVDSAGCHVCRLYLKKNTKNRCILDLLQLMICVKGRFCELPRPLPLRRKKSSVFSSCKDQCVLNAKIRVLLHTKIGVFCISCALWFVWLTCIHIFLFTLYLYLYSYISISIYIYSECIIRILRVVIYITNVYTCIQFTCVVSHNQNQGVIQYQNWSVLYLLRVVTYMTNVYTFIQFTCVVSHSQNQSVFTYRLCHTQNQSIFTRVVRSSDSANLWVVLLHMLWRNEKSERESEEESRSIWGGYEQ